MIDGTTAAPRPDRGGQEINVWCERFARSADVAGPADVGAVTSLFRPDAQPEEFLVPAPVRTVWRLRGDVHRGFIVVDVPSDPGTGPGDAGGGRVLASRIRGDARTLTLCSRHG